MQKILENFYNIIPPPLQNFAISSYGFYWYKRRFGGIFRKEIEECKKRENYTQEQWNEYHLNLLRELLIHAYKTVPYYKNKFNQLGLTLQSLSNFQLSQINTLPILEKTTYRELGLTELLSSKKDPKGAFFLSSGSTGTPTQTYYSRKMHQKYFAIFEARVNNWANITYKTPRGTFGPRRIVKDANAEGPFYRYNYIEKQVYFSAFHINAKNVKSYLEGLYKYKVEYLTGYCMSNYFLARFIEEVGLKAPKLRAVLTSSEKLTDEIRDTFRRVYGCETFDAYNGVECCNLVSECEHHSLHIIPDMGITEILNSNGEPCKPGESGQVVATGFLNFDQPLIRYRMGDIVKLSENQSCKCGRSMPVVEEIVGRIMDTVIGKDGREMVSFYRVFSGNMKIIESQLIQHTLDDFEIKLVLANPLSEDEEATIRQKMHSQLGDITIQINIVNSIPKGPNGKFKSVISHIKREEIKKTI